METDSSFRNFAFFVLFRIADDGQSPKPSNPESPYKVKKIYTQQALQCVTVLGAPDSNLFYFILFFFVPSVVFIRVVPQISLFTVGGHQPAL
jgi:hypothetical protein